MSRDVDFFAECERPSCKATFAACYDSRCAGYSWQVCTTCWAVDAPLHRDRWCECGGRLIDWRFYHCPKCRGPISVYERLLPPY